VFKNPEDLKFEGQVTFSNAIDTLHNQLLDIDLNFAEDEKDE